MRRPAMVFLMLCGMTARQAGAEAAVPLPASAKINQVVFAGDANYPPHQFLDQNSQPAGFDVELFRALARRQRLDVEVRLGNWDERLKQLESGKVDVVPMFVSPERAQRFLFSKPFMSRYHLVFGHKRNGYLSSLDELAGRRVAVQYGGLAWEALRAATRRAVIIPVNVEAGALSAVARGEADYALVPVTIGYGAVIDHDFKDIVALSPPLLQRDYVFAVTPSRPDLLRRINAGISQVQVSGEQDRLYLHWLANLVPPAQSYRSGVRTGLWIALPLLVFTVCVFFWWRRAKRNADLYSARASSEAKSRRKAEARALHLAFHNTVTGLPNHNALEKTLSNLIWPGRSYALVRIDLLGMDMIYAIAGEGMVREVLRAVGQRLAASYGSEMVADLGRGRFVVIFNVENVEAAMQATQRLAALIQQRLQLGTLPLEQRCRSGLAVFPQHAKSGEALLRSAEMACASAHEHGLSHQVYHAGLEPDARNLILLADLRDAISQKTLGYAVQPKLDIASGRFVGAEMLVRWEHPAFGPLPPNVFVPLAEKMGAIGQMTRYMVLQALQHCREWQRQGIDFSLSVNVSGNDLADQSLVNAMILQSGELGHRLMLEVTETEIMRDAKRVLASVAMLRECGIRISLDDFGTGYSSFSYLQRLAPDELKIDCSFITHMLDSPDDRAIVRNTISLAHDLNARVTAEGIEDAATLEYLAELGCDMGQGYAIARPMAIGELMRSLELQPTRMAGE